MDFIKEELNSEEKFFEKAVVTERFLKKYKKSIVTVISLIVIVAFANLFYEAQERSRIEKANATLAVLTANPTDLQAQNALRELSPKLYTAWSFARAVKTNDTKRLGELKNSKMPVVDDLAAYEAAVRSADQEELSGYELRQNAIYRDLAIVESAVVFMNQHKIQEAKEKLAMIGEESPLKGIAKILNHYGVK